MNQFEVVTSLGELSDHYSVKETRIVRINVDKICSAYPITFEGWCPDRYKPIDPFELTVFNTVDGAEHIVYRYWHEFSQFGSFFDASEKIFNEDWVK